MGKKQAPGLGRSLRRGGRAGGAGWRHTGELSEQGRGPPPQSVTEQSPLEAFLAAAELAGAAFAAEKLNVRLAPGCGAAEEAGRSREEEEAAAAQRVLRVPRRPPWDGQTSPVALNQAERDSFLRWRRKLAWLEEEENLLLTPFERNLDFWRQLWRVLERSDVVVQIVDARNPLLFRCRDLVASRIKQPRVPDVLRAPDCDRPDSDEERMSVVPHECIVMGPELPPGPSGSSSEHQNWL